MKIINQPSRNGLFFMYIFIFIGSLIWYGPNVIFYFDQEIADAKITSISKNYVSIRYFHGKKEMFIALSIREGNSKKLRTLVLNTEVKIAYSKNFPEKISIINFHGKPSLDSLIIIFFYSVPTLFFKNIK